MAKKVSMEDLARELGISKNTVSLVLRGMPGISRQTRELVLDAAKRFGYEYKKSEMPSETRESTSKNICLIMSKSTRDTVGFFSLIQFGIEDEAKRNQVNTIIYYYDENEEFFETPLCVKEGIVEGIITLGRISLKTIQAIQCFNLPLVMVDHYFDNIKTDCILTDNLSSAYMAVEYLIRRSHSKIGFIGDIRLSISFYDRYQGYLKALDNYGLSAGTTYSLTHKSMEHLANENLELVMQELKSLPQALSAIFCCNDAEAIALYKAFSIMGIRVPEDISIIGFDDIESSRNISPGLTTMRVDKELMGKRAVQRLLMRMENRSIAEEKLLISTRLIERQSVRKVNL